MREDVKDRWVDALRSDVYCQTRETLRDCEGFCCLGVLCDLYIQETEDTYSLRARTWEVKHVFHVSVVNTGKHYYEKAVLPWPVREWAGIETADGSFDNDQCLTSMNDAGLSFDEIADIIELKWKRL